MQDALVRAYVGVTDGAWYRFLADRQSSEVNFWRPSSAASFRALTPGEPFLFKSHHPHNRVVGGGFFSGFAQLRISEAWEFFGEANGAATLHDMRARVSHYRRQALAPGEDPKIGCVFVRDTVFFRSHESVEPPPDFAPNIVQGKGYSVEAANTASYFEEVLRRILSQHPTSGPQTSWHGEGPVYGDSRLSPHRLGQQAFQAVVLDAYGRRCAVTGDKIRPVLQAAHIRPLPSGGEHRLDNGLLLRSDVHTLFDRGYLSVDPQHRLAVSPRLRDEFDNGEEFYSRSNTVIALPERPIDRPRREFLEWHRDQVFLAS